MKKKRTYRGMIIGCGAIGVTLVRDARRPKSRSHSEALSHHPRVRLVGLVDTDDKKLKGALRLYPHARGYTNMGTALTIERPDIVIVATSPSARLSIIRQCLRRNVPMIICGKPLAQSSKEAKEIERLVAGSKSVFVVNYQRRFYPLIDAVRNEIRARKIGRIHQVSCFYSNGLYNNGGHVLDAVHYLTDESLVSAQGVVHAANTTHPAKDRNIDCLLTTDKGTTVVLQSFNQRDYGASEIRIFGEKGGYFIREYGFTVVRILPKPSVFKGVKQLDYMGARTVSDPQSAVDGALIHAIDCYENKRVPRSSARSAAQVIRVLDAITKSAEQNKTVRI